MKISLSTTSLTKRIGYEKTFEVLSRNGFEAVDFDFDDYLSDMDSIKKSMCYKNEQEIIEFYSLIKGYANRYNIEIHQTHAGFSNYDISLTDEFFKLMIGSIIATHTLGSHYLVIHPVIMYERINDDFEKESFELNVKFYNKLLPYLEKYDVKIGLEPMWNELGEGDYIKPSCFSRPENILKFIDIVGDKHFCACLDYGHIAITGKHTNDTVDGAILKLGKCMKIVHIHENDTFLDYHTIPFSYPDWDWKKILVAMKEINYQGNINFEIGDVYFNHFKDEELDKALQDIYQVGIKFKNYLLK